VRFLAQGSFSAGLLFYPRSVLLAPRRVARLPV